MKNSEPQVWNDLLPTDVAGFQQKVNPEGYNGKYKVHSKRAGQALLLV